MLLNAVQCDCKTVMFLHPLTPLPVLASHPQLSVLHDQILHKSWEIRQEICSFDSDENFLIC